MCFIFENTNMLNTYVQQKLPGNTNRRCTLRNACFTINNPTVEAAAFVQTLIDSHLVSYIVVGKEVGASGTPHYQGYVEFNNSLAFDTVRVMLLHGHIEARRGTSQEASQYCQKDGEFLSWGEMSKQGNRTDIEVVANMVKEYNSIRVIAMEYPVQYIKFHKGILGLQSALIEARTNVPEVRVYYGPTGCGKSYNARVWLPNAYVWHPQQGQWFDGYRGESEVIFEEFRGQIPFGMLLSLLDRYDCKVQYKGGVCEFAATKIAFTSPVSAYQWYSLLDDNDRMDQLIRRISDMIHLKVVFTP